MINGVFVIVIATVLMSLLMQTRRSHLRQTI